MHFDGCADHLLAPLVCSLKVRMHFVTFVSFCSNSAEGTEAAVNGDDLAGNETAAGITQ